MIRGLCSAMDMNRKKTFQPDSFSVHEKDPAVVFVNLFHSAADRYVSPSCLSFIRLKIGNFNFRFPIYIFFNQAQLFIQSDFFIFIQFNKRVCQP